MLVLREHQLEASASERTRARHVSISFKINTQHTRNTIRKRPTARAGCARVHHKPETLECCVIREHLWNHYYTTFVLQHIFVLTELHARKPAHYEINGRTRRRRRQRDRDDVISCRYCRRPWSVVVLVSLWMCADRPIVFKSDDEARTHQSASRVARQTASGGGGAVPIDSVGVGKRRLFEFCYFMPSMSVVGKIKAFDIRIISTLTNTCCSFDGCWQPLQ